jgi:hypothetical protein
MRFAAILFCLKCVLFPFAFGLILYALVTQNPGLIHIAIGAMIVAGLVVIIQWILAQRTNCPLCMTPVLAKKSCMKHRAAKSFMGSHRLRVALAVLFKGSFRCPYCNEPTAMELRDRGNYRSYSRG